MQYSSREFKSGYTSGLLGEFLLSQWPKSRRDLACWVKGLGADGALEVRRTIHGRMAILGTLMAPLATSSSPGAATQASAENYLWLDSQARLDAQEEVSRRLREELPRTRCELKQFKSLDEGRFKTSSQPSKHARVATGSEFLPSSFFAWFQFPGLGLFRRSLRPIAMAVCCARVLLLALIARAEDVDWSPRPTIYDNAGQKSLYAPDGPVDLLKGSSCDLSPSSSWQSMGQTWLVEYYHSSCPHCWYFAPVFRQLAAAYQGSRSLRVAACNCAAEENRNACDAMQIYRYPSIQVFKASRDGSAVKLYDVSHTDKEGHAKSAVDILQWLEDHQLPAALHPTAAQKGANFEAAKFLSPGSPPGRPGWSWDWRPDDERFVEARLGLIALLNSYNGSPEAHAAALRMATFVAKNCLQECDLYAQLVHRLEGADSTAESVRAEVSRWSGLFARRKHIFCKDETCAVWQLFHVMAGSVAAEALHGRLVPQHVSTALQWNTPPTPAEAMSFYREAVDHFLFCDFCRDHFLRAYDGCEFGRCEVLSLEHDQAKRLVLWLWRMHNAVSLRVLREHPPHGKAIDRRWPTYRDCPGCWTPSVVNGEVLDKENLDSAFDLERVYGFLLSSYVGRENVEKHLPLQSKVLTDADAERGLLGSTHLQIFQIASALLGAVCFVLFTLRWSVDRVGMVIFLRYASDPRIFDRTLRVRCLDSLCGIGNDNARLCCSAGKCCSGTAETLLGVGVSNQQAKRQEETAMLQKHILEAGFGQHLDRADRELRRILWQEAIHRHQVAVLRIRGRTFRHRDDHLRRKRIRRAGSPAVPYRRCSTREIASRLG
eukprot:s884_g5.t2